MKASELTGAQLDYWVAKAERGDTETLSDFEFWKRECWEVGVDRFSSNWAQGGPIIDVKKINIQNTAAGINAAVYQPHALVRWYSGPTVLVAAMRAYVVSKFGEEVEQS